MGPRHASKAPIGLAGAAVQKQELKLWECAASLNFWLLFLVFGAGTGTGLMFVNNLGAHPGSLDSQPLFCAVYRPRHDICSAVICASILIACVYILHQHHEALLRAGQLVESLGGGRDGQDVLVSLFSVFSAAGRLACGSIPERLLQSYGLPR